MSRKIAKQTGLSTKLQLAMRTGIYVAGYKKAILKLIKQEAKCIIVAANCPEVMRKVLEYYSALAKDIPIKYYEGSNNELSVLSGLKYRTSVITILDQGEADLVEVK